MTRTSWKLPGQAPLRISQPAVRFYSIRPSMHVFTLSSIWHLRVRVRTHLSSVVHAVIGIGQHRQPCSTRHCHMMSRGCASSLFFVVWGPACHHD